MLRILKGLLQDLNIMFIVFLPRYLYYFMALIYRHVTKHEINYEDQGYLSNLYLKILILSCTSYNKWISTF
jgi:hypothetical protein